MRTAYLRNFGYSFIYKCSFNWTFKKYLSFHFVISYIKNWFGILYCLKILPSERSESMSLYVLVQSQSKITFYTTEFCFWIYSTGLWRKQDILSFFDLFLTRRFVVRLWQGPDVSTQSYYRPLQDLWSEGRDHPRPLCLVKDLRCNVPLGRNRLIP